MITILPYNETHIKISCDDYGVEQELAEFFTFDVTGAKFAPAFKSGIWDGKIRLYNLRTHLIYKGLIELIFKFAKTRGYAFTADQELDSTISISREEVAEYMTNLNMYGRGSPIEIRGYQIDAVHKALSNRRLILESATSSGKSLIIYSIIRYSVEHQKQLVLIVPTVNLVNQMIGDFKDYSSMNGWDVDQNVHSLYAGKDRVFDKNVIVSTWQTLLSMIKQDKDNYAIITSRTDVLLADECHTLKATMVTKVIEGFITTEHRVGFTGTMY